MKKTIFILICLLFLSGCGANTLDYSFVTRDKYNTGGNIQFEYDNLSHTAYFGGEGQTLTYYQSDIAKGWEKSGARLGLTLIAPVKIREGKTLEVESEEEIDYYFDDQTNSLSLYPIITKQKSHMTFSITWLEGYKEQDYHIVVREGTVILEE